MKLELPAFIITIIAFLVGLFGDFLPKVRIIVCVAAGCIFIITLIWVAFKRLYNVKKIGEFYLRRSTEGFIIEKRSKIYIFDSKENAQHEIEHDIMPTRNMRAFSDKLRWSGPIDIKETEKNLTVKPPHKIVDVKDIETWHCYSILLSRIYHKGDPVNIKVTLKNLKDDNHISQPFLSSGIASKTKELTLCIKIKHPLNVQNVQMQIFRSYDAENAFFTKNLAPEVSNGNREYLVYTYAEKFPIVGYRYKIVWDWV